LYYENHPDYKKCRSCLNWKLVDEFHFHSRVTGSRFTECKECQRESEKIKSQKEIEEKGGSEKIPSKPNQYKDRYQKEQTFMVMEVLGYIYDEGDGIWTKPGIKELVDGKIVFSKVGKNKKYGAYNSKVGTNKLQLMKELRDKGYSYNKIADILDVSDTTVFKYLNAKTDFDYYASTEHKIKFGAQYTFHTFLPNLFTANQDSKFL
jgi:DNA invertase Pin-like site-specific DNA recombinase